MDYIENRTFDEIAVGDSAEITRSLTREDINVFAVMSGDVNPAHLDDDYAQKGSFSPRHRPWHVGRRADIRRAGHPPARPGNDLSRPVPAFPWPGRCGRYDHEQRHGHGQECREGPCHARLLLYQPEGRRGHQRRGAGARAAREGAPAPAPSCRRSRCMRRVHASRRSWNRPASTIRWSPPWCIPATS